MFSISFFSLDWNLTTSSINSFHYASICLFSVLSIIFSHSPIKSNKSYPSFNYVLIFIILIFTQPVTLVFFSFSKKNSFSGVNVKYLSFHLKMIPSVFFCSQPCLSTVVLLISESFFNGYKIWFFLEWLMCLLCLIAPNSPSWVFLSSSSSLWIIY